MVENHEFQLNEKVFVIDPNGFALWEAMIIPINDCKSKSLYPDYAHEDQELTNALLGSSWTHGPTEESSTPRNPLGRRNCHLSIRTNRDLSAKTVVMTPRIMQILDIRVIRKSKERAGPRKKQGRIPRRGSETIPSFILLFDTEFGGSQILLLLFRRILLRWSRQ
jgi:hypothetical protein